MSRALDKGIKEALRHGDHEGVYTAVADALTRRHKLLLDIELLGVSHPTPDDAPFLQDDNALAFPKLRLIQAFIVARQKLRVPALPRDEVLRATAVALLMDAENLTAANTRKRVLADGCRGSAGLDKALLSEKYLVDSLLTSRLHRHTKSPTLWSHRRWLLGRMRAAGLPVDAAGDLRRVVLVAAERHPRNYYAWSHARHMVDVYHHTTNPDATDTSTRPDVTGPDTDGLVDDVRRWCLAHRDDVSGWMFLLFLLAWRGPVPQQQQHCDRARRVLDDTLRLASKYQWRNESVWYFLRNLAASELVDDPGVVRQALEQMRGAGAHDDKETTALRRTGQWLERYARADGETRG